MGARRPKPVLMVTDDERAQLTPFACSRSSPASLSARTRMIHSNADGEANNSIAERLQLGKAMVGKWLTRLIERRVVGVTTLSLPGPQHTIDDERIGGLINTILHTKPASGSTHRSARLVLADQHLQKQRATLLPVLRVAAVSLGELRAVDQSVLHQKAARCGRFVTEPVQERAGHLCGGKEPVPSARAHATDAANGLQLCRGCHVGPQTPRHDHAVRGTQRVQRCGACKLCWPSRLARRPTVRCE